MIITTIDQDFVVVSEKGSFLLVFSFQYLQQALPQSTDF